MDVMLLLIEIRTRGVHSIICKIARANNIGVFNIKKTYITYL